MVQATSEMVNLLLGLGAIGLVAHLVQTQASVDQEPTPEPVPVRVREDV